MGACTRYIFLSTLFGGLRSAYFFEYLLWGVALCVLVGEGHALHLLLLLLTDLSLKLSLLLDERLEFVELGAFLVCDQRLQCWNTLLSGTSQNKYLNL